VIAPFFIAGFDTPSDLCCRIRLYNKGLCPLTPEFIALGFRRSNIKRATPSAAPSNK